MSVREYIGARYVPVFADPIQWDPTLVYEPLTVVTNEGASYVSRKMVPAGIQIDNTDYWILWADFNAQLQHYIDEVNTFDGRIDDLEAKYDANGKLEDNLVITDSITDGSVTFAKLAADVTLHLPTFEDTALFNVTKYGADNTGETDSYAAIIAAATAADGVGSLYFPDGIYSISQPLDLTEFDIHSIYGNGCVLQPYDNAVIDYLIWPFVDTVQEHKSHFHEISGINFNGLGTANVGLRTSQQIIVKDCNFTNFLTYCISNYNNTNDGQGLRIYDCQFINNIIDTTTYINAIAVKCSYDNIFENCRFFGYKRSIEIDAGHNQFNNLYFWSRAATFETTAVYCTGYTQDCEYVNCYFDTINICVHNAGSAFTNCVFLNGGGDSNSHDCYLINWTVSTGGIIAVYTGCRFSWVNTISNSYMKVCNNQRLSIQTIGCIFNDYFPKNNVLGNLYKSLVIDDTAKRTVDADMSAGVWYKFAHANKQSNLGDGTQWYVGMMVGLSTNGRNLIFEKVSTRSSMEYQEQFSGYSLRQLGAIGVIQTGSTMDFYFKPTSALDLEIYINEVWGGNNLNAVWVDYEETTLQDSDMTAIIAAA